MIIKWIKNSDILNMKIWLKKIEREIVFLWVREGEGIWKLVLLVYWGKNILRRWEYIIRIICVIYFFYLYRFYRLFKKSRLMLERLKISLLVFLILLMIFWSSWVSSRRVILGSFWIFCIIFGIWCNWFKGRCYSVNIVWIELWF